MANQEQKEQLQSRDTTSQSQEQAPCTLPPGGRTRGLSLPGAQEARPQAGAAQCQQWC